jgi:hypothetical protein
MLKTVRGVNALSIGKVAGIVYACIGLLAGTIIALVSLLGGFAGLMSRDSGGAPLISMFLGVGAVLVFPILYGIVGAIVATIIGAAYNLAARVVGGIELDVE